MRSLLFTLLVGCLLLAAGAASSQTVDIPDSNLRAVIEAELGKVSGVPITAVEMATLTELEAPNTNIRDLTGLEFAINLNELDLGSEGERTRINSNSVSDLSPLARLTKLTSLNLDRNSISDISPLARLTKLTSLVLDNNSISDISPLAGLTKLIGLFFYNNSVADISSLAGLTKLKWLALHINPVSDISPLAGLTKLTWLRLHDNLISDISPLTGLTNLKNLGLHGNSISDISVLAGLTSLEDLNLFNNSISDISPLVSLTNLRVLVLSTNSISDISPLVGLTNLTDLELSRNTISDLSPLVSNTGLNNGDRIDVRYNPLSETSINIHLPTLRSRGVTVDGKIVDTVKMDQAKLFFPAITPVSIGDTFTLNLTVEDITDLAGWQLNIAFNPVVLQAISVTEGDFLSKTGGSTFFQAGSINNTTGTITGLIAARISAGGISGTGSLLSINFEAKVAGEGNLKLHEARLGDPNGDAIPHELVINLITVSTSWDINGDGQINVFDLILVAQNFGQANPQVDFNNDGTVDILDLVVVAQRIDESTTGLAPAVLNGNASRLHATMIQNWIDMAHTADDGSLAFRQGIANLKHLLGAIRPDKTALLANYPNPFNPETWIPYHLAHDADVTFTIYDIKGTVVRQFSLGYQQAGYYTNRTKAVYWDGRNNLGEPVGSGVYFYQLQAEDYSEMRKMVILK